MEIFILIQLVRKCKYLYTIMQIYKENKKYVSADVQYVKVIEFY